MRLTKEIFQWLRMEGAVQDGDGRALNGSVFELSPFTSDHVLSGNLVAKVLARHFQRTSGKNGLGLPGGDAATLQRLAQNQLPSAAPSERCGILSDFPCAMNRFSERSFDKLRMESAMHFLRLIGWVQAIHVECAGSCARPAGRRPHVRRQVADRSRRRRGERSLSLSVSCPLTWMPTHFCDLRRWP